MKVVVKVGTNVILKGSRQIDLEVILEMARTIRRFREAHKFIIVTSGAVAMGSVAYPVSDIIDQQVAASIGQPELMDTYRQIFGIFDITISQVLYTYPDLTGKNSVATKMVLERTLKRGITPIINENDPVVADEIKALASFGDNARLAALVSQLIGADLLVLLSDVDGLYTQDPRFNSGSSLIEEVPLITDEIIEMASSIPSSSGKGGMQANVEAARLATTAGIKTIIANGKQLDILSKIMSGQKVGTTFLPSILD